MNVVHLIGRLAGDPRTRRRAGRQPMTTIRVAVARRGTPAPDEPADDSPAYVDVVTYGERAEVVAAHLRRGHLVGVTGRLEYHDQPTADEHRSQHYVVAAEVDFLDGGQRR